MYNIIQGGRTDDATNQFLVKLKKDAVSYDPLDLTNATAITTCFQNADGTEVMLALGSGLTVIGNPILGAILITLTAAQTALLRVLDAGTLELAITFNTTPVKYQFPNAYAVLQSQC